jgi:hypothetical protein
MANKEKNTKEEPYLLQDEEQVGEAEKATYITYDLEDDRDSEEFEKEITKRKPEEVNIDPDSNTATVKEDEISEVEKTQVLKYDIKKSSDVKALQQMLDKGVESEKITIGTDGTISISEGVKNNNQILTTESFKKLVKNFNKINLSESEIMSILEETQNPKMTKSELLETIQNNLISEAQMNDNVRQNFESGENDYQDILGQELTNQLAQEAFQEIADDIRRKTGRQNVSLGDVQNLLGTSLMAAAQEEYRIGIENLERKAVEMIRKQYNIPANAVEFDAKIVGLPPQMLVGSDMSPEQMERLSRQANIKVGKINRQGLKMDRGTSEPPQGKSEEELKPQIKRRRLTNAMMHGAARKSQNLHHMDDQLRDENPQLGRNYANVMAANDANYFLIDDATIRSEGESGIHAGNVRIDLSNREKPKVIAQGMIFPILLHELSKGVVELMSLWGLSEDSEERRYVLDKTDNLSSETNDIRLGTKIWERFVEQIPVDNQEVISLTWNMLQELSDYEYNQVIEGLIRKSTDAQNKVRRMAEEALSELQREASDDAFGGYEDSPEAEEDGDTLTPPEEEGGREVTPSPEIDEPSESDYESMSRRELEIELDSALDAGDMDLVRQIGSILNTK